MTNDQGSKASISPQAKALSLYIRNAVEHLKTNSASESNKDNSDQSSLIYLGNWQDPYPRLLVTDPVLEPVDKLVWQIIRLHISAPGAVTAFPNYETVRTFANIKSNHTVARALAILRATRWLSLCARVRDVRGRYLGNIYVLHDEPVTLGDAMYLDSEYMTFLQTSLAHNHPRVKRIVENVIATIEEMIGDGLDVTGERIQTWSYERRLGVIAQGQHEPSLQLSERNEFYAISDSRIHALAEDEEQRHGQIMHMEDGNDDPVQIVHTAPMGESTHVQKTHMDQTAENRPVQNMHTDENIENGQVQKLHTAICSSSNNINTTTTNTPTPRVREALHFPPRISANERKLAMMYLESIDELQQQDVLDEWHGRLLAANRRSTPIENPIGYLASLCRRIKSGEFQITIGLRIRETREREQQREEQEKLDTQAEQRKQEALLQSMQNKSGATGTSRIQQRMEKIRKKSQAGDPGHE